MQSGRGTVTTSVLRSKNGANGSWREKLDSAGRLLRQPGGFEGPRLAGVPPNRADRRRVRRAGRAAARPAVPTCCEPMLLGLVTPGAVRLVGTTAALGVVDAELRRMMLRSERRRRNRERERRGQQHRCDLLAHFLLSFLCPPRFFPARPERRNESLGPKTMQAREPVRSLIRPTAVGEAVFRPPRDSSKACPEYVPRCAIPCVSQRPEMT